MYREIIKQVMESKYQDGFAPEETTYGMESIMSAHICVNGVEGEGIVRFTWTAEEVAKLGEKELPVEDADHAFMVEFWDDSVEEPVLIDQWSRLAGDVWM